MRFPAPTIQACVITVTHQTSGPLIVVTTGHDLLGKGPRRRHSFSLPAEALAAVADFLSDAVGDRGRDEVGLA
jgi:hypothetical protein